MIQDRKNSIQGKTGAVQAVAPKPCIELKAADPRPLFKASEPVKIRLEAVCKNMPGSGRNLKYHWFYTDSEGFKKSSVTEKPAVMLSCPNAFCGRTMTVKVEVLVVILEDSAPLQTETGWYPAIAETVKGSITLFPVCEKKLAAQAEWTPRTSEMDRQVQAEVEASGYNYTEVELERYILDGNETIWKSRDRTTVRDNTVTAVFDRVQSGISGPEDKPFTFRFRIVDPNDGRLLGDYSRDFVVKARTTVTALNTFFLQPVVTGNVDIAENNFMPCKYTQIDVEYTKDRAGEKKSTASVFKEGSPTKQKINIIGGKRKATVTLMGYTPQKCKLAEEPHSGMTAVLSRPGQPPELLPVSLSGETGKIEGMELSYKYGSIADVVKLLWLPHGKAQTNRLGVSTCRHEHVVEMDMLPDVEWEAYIKISEAGAKFYSHTKMPEEHAMFERHQKKAMDAGKKETFKIDKTEVSFAFSAKYADSLTLDLAAKFKPSIEKVAEMLQIIMKALNKISFKDTIDANRDKIKPRNIAPKSSKVPLFIEISNPAFELGGGWQYDVNRYNMPARKGEIAVAASPLIKAKGGIDLVAASTYIPVAGSIIKAVLAANDLAEWLTTKTSGGRAGYEGKIWFNLYLSGSISLKGIFEFSEEEKQAELEAPTTIVLGVELGLKAEVSTKTVTIKGETERTVKAGISGDAKTSVKVNPGIGYDFNDGLFLDLKVTFGGIVVTVSGEVKYEKNRDGHKGSSKEAGFEIEKEFQLVKPSELWKGRLYPFKEKTV